LGKQAATMVNVIPLTKARINLGQVVRRVHVGKEYFILEKDGIPVAGIMNIDEFEDYLELQNSKTQRFVKEAAAEHRAGKGRAASEVLAGLGRKKQPRAR
jgi:antitoxin (DNA-binding transcriptional repressor) of toxin-antitoxin stability system